MPRPQSFFRKADLSNPWTHPLPRRAGATRQGPTNEHLGPDTSRKQYDPQFPGHPSYFLAPAFVVTTTTLEPAFLIGCRREASETPSGQGARRTGNACVLDSTSRNPNKRNAVPANGSGTGAGHWGEMRARVARARVHTANHSATTAPLRPSITRRKGRYRVPRTGVRSTRGANIAYRPSLGRLGVRGNEEVNVGTFTEGQRKYLAHHRRERCSSTLEDWTERGPRGRYWGSVEQPNRH